MDSERLQDLYAEHGLDHQEVLWEVLEGSQYVPGTEGEA